MPVSGPARGLPSLAAGRPCYEHVVDGRGEVGVAELLAGPLVGLLAGYPGG